MKRFEYRIDMAIRGRDLVDLEEKLDELGEDGWQIVYVDHLSQREVFYLVYAVLMREVEEKNAKED